LGQAIGLLAFREINNKMVKFWWWNGRMPGNFGDILTPLILEHFNIPYEWSTEFEAISIGSIAKVAQPGTIVLGSGVISERDYVCADADWRFVRGPHTRKKIVNAGGQCPEIYGDPAMLMPLLVDPAPAKYDVGIVPHYTQYQQIKEKYHKHCVVNLITNNPIETIKTITQCRSIISSSLHGVIIAHAYGIPAAWVDFGYIKGDGVKFLDHYDSLNIPAQKSSLKNPVFTAGSLAVTPIIRIFQDLKDQIQ
jgi:hypothetical protein